MYVDVVLKRRGQKKICLEGKHGVWKDTKLRLGREVESYHIMLVISIVTA